MPLEQGLVRVPYSRAASCLFGVIACIYDMLTCSACNADMHETRFWGVHGRLAPMGADAVFVIHMQMSVVRHVCMSVCYLLQQPIDCCAF